MIEAERDWIEGGSDELFEKLRRGIMAAGHKSGGAVPQSNLELVGKQAEAIMKGLQLKLVKRIIAAGNVLPIVDFATSVRWSSRGLDKRYDNLRKEASDKLLPLGWKIRTRDRVAHIVSAAK